MIAVALLLIIYAQLCQSVSILTNFQHEFLRNDWQSLKECQTRSGQALYMMRNHFINRKQYSNSDWKRFEADLVVNDHEDSSLSKFMTSFNDRYTTFIPKPSMEKRWQNGQGMTMSHGIQFERRWRLGNISRFLRAGLCKLHPSRVGLIAAHLIRRPLLLSKELLKLSLVSSAAAIAIKYRSRLNIPLLCGIVFGATTSLVLDFIYPMEVKHVAEDASHGLKVGDEVVAVDHKLVLFWTPRNVMKYLSNRNSTLEVRRTVASPNTTVGTETTLHSVRVCEELLGRPSIHCSLYRNPFSAVNASVSKSQDCIGLLGQIAIKDFSETTYHEISLAVSDLKKRALHESNKTLQGLVFDLRQNTGGVVESALDTAAMFLPKGAILLKMDFGNKMQSTVCTSGQPDLTTPLLVLCDSCTASASEILINAWVDNSRCTTMGCRTYGKNIAQSLVPLSDGSGVAFTVAEYFTPLGKSAKEGHTPMVPLTQEEVSCVDVTQIGYDDSDGKWKVI